MLLVPFVVGAVRGAADHGLSWTLVPLFGCWFVGYLAYFAASRWLTSRRKTRYRRPMLVYGAIAAACGLVVLAMDAPLAAWVPVFVPFLALGLWAASRRRERTVLAGAAMVVAAGLMTLVVYDACRPAGLRPGAVFGVGGGVPGSVHDGDGGGVLLAAALLVAYFFGTVLYVKTMIRERGNRGYVIASVGYHGAVTLGCAALALGRDAAWWWAAAAFVVLTARAWLLAGRSVSPRTIGIGEIAATAAVGAVAVLVR